MSDDRQVLVDLVRERAKQIFRFLKALAERNTPISRSITDHQWVLRLAELPQHPSLSVGEVELTGSGDETSAANPEHTEPLIRVRRPKLTPPPTPPRILDDWLQGNWQVPDGQVEAVPARNIVKGREPVAELFETNPSRVVALTEWKESWVRWAEAERPARLAMRIFERVYELYGRIELESERVELVLGDGRLRWRRSDGLIDHPVLLQRVELLFDPETPEFRVVDTDRAPELYTAILQDGESLSAERLAKLRSELEKGGYHPLASEATSAYLRRLVQLLGPCGEFQYGVSEPETVGTDPLVVRDPVLFLRSRSAGFPAAFDRVLQDLEAGAAVPVSLTRLVGIEPPPNPDPPPDHLSPWGEPPDVLLSKPANAEQIEIARALDRHNAVLVQGPPGTGKSHTIANLIGHLVAHGKRVLVTSHTTKALRVLRGQVVNALQPLCVAVLENDLEGRVQMEQAVRGILSRLTLASDQGLAEEVKSLSATRADLIGDIERLTNEVATAREAEYRSIVIGGDSHAPAEAARWIHSNAAGNDWIPGRVEPGAPLPLPARELLELYETNRRVTAPEEHEIEAGLTSAELLPSSDEFAADVAALAADEPSDLAAFWTRAAGEDEIEGLEQLLVLLERTASDLADLVPWQRAVVAAGHSGGPERDLWNTLARQVAGAVQRWEETRATLLDYSPELATGVPWDIQNRVAGEIAGHLESGGSLNRWSLLFRGEWKSLIRAWRVNGGEPATAFDFRAIGTQLSLNDMLRQLGQRWLKQAEPAGLPTFGTMLPTPEPALQEYAAQFGPLLEWWLMRWRVIEATAGKNGFRWNEFRSREVARSSPASPHERDVAILSGPLQAAVRYRLGLAKRNRSLRKLAAIQDALTGQAGPVCSRIRSAARGGDSAAYEPAIDELIDLRRKSEVCETRRKLLDRLAVAAETWAASIRERADEHGEASPPGDVAQAWRWKQLKQEIDRRANLDEVALTRRLHQRRAELRDITAQLIDRMAWLSQLRRTDLNARQALQGWADTQRRIGKGTGKRAPQLQVQARELLAKARNAVPVWIMPLARVAESFGPTQGRFDVVIVDEASQSDVMGLLAWYLGDRVAIVGDHEQVSPLAVGQEISAVQALIGQHLSEIPNNHLYDGTMSVYHLARQSFGGTIALREHFRCVPDIIEFSNSLAYNGEIRPLREAGSAPRPHLIECVVDGAMRPSKTGKENLAEAQLVAAIVKALIERPEYAGKSMGAISLVGDDQAYRIQDLALKLVGAGELDKRRFVAGNSAQYQGDERDVMFLSMVDAPTGSPLALRATELFKQRYNVAASRAKDQLWLVHSLSPERDLKAGDLRRRLIEHFRDPSARQRAMQVAERRAESLFEIDVARRLIAANYRVRPQVWVGRYRIDMVVTDGTRQVAVECDGDRFHGFDEIPADMARQAVLERAGWRFIRVRGTRFYRDPEGTMSEVLGELRLLQIEPIGEAGEAESAGATSNEFRESVLWRAWEIMRKEGWIQPDKTGSAEAESADHPELF